MSLEGIVGEFALINTMAAGDNTPATATLLGEVTNFVPPPITRRTTPVVTGVGTEYNLSLQGSPALQATATIARFNDALMRAAGRELIGVGEAAARPSITAVANLYDASGRAVDRLVYYCEGAFDVAGGALTNPIPAYSVDITMDCIKFGVWRVAPGDPININDITNALQYIDVLTGDVIRGGINETAAFRARFGVS